MTARSPLVPRAELDEALAALDRARAGLRLAEGALSRLVMDTPSDQALNDRILEQIRAVTGDLNVVKVCHEDWPPMSADANLIAQSRTLLPALVAELRDLRAKVDAASTVIRAEHQPAQYGRDGITHACQRCSSWSWEGLDDETVPWPCPTVAALGEVAGRDEDNNTKETS